MPKKTPKPVDLFAPHDLNSLLTPKLPFDLTAPRPHSTARQRPDILPYVKSDSRVSMDFNAGGGEMRLAPLAARYARDPLTGYTVVSRPGAPTKYFDANHQIKTASAYQQARRAVVGRQAQQNISRRPSAHSVMDTGLLGSDSRDYGGYQPADRTYDPKADLTTVTFKNGNIVQYGRHGTQRALVSGGGYYPPTSDIRKQIRMFGAAPGADLPASIGPMRQQNTAQRIWSGLNEGIENTREYVHNIVGPFIDPATSIPENSYASGQHSSAAAQWEEAAARTMDPNLKARFLERAKQERNIESELQNGAIGGLNAIAPFASPVARTGVAAVQSVTDHSVSPLTRSLGSEVGEEHGQENAALAFTTALGGVVHLPGKGGFAVEKPPAYHMVPERVKPVVAGRTGPAPPPRPTARPEGLKAVGSAPVSSKYHAEGARPIPASDTAPITAKPGSKRTLSSKEAPANAGASFELRRPASRPSELASRPKSKLDVAVDAASARLKTRLKNVKVSSSIPGLPDPQLAGAVADAAIIATRKIVKAAGSSHLDILTKHFGVTPETLQASIKERLKNLKKLADINDPDGAKLQDDIAKYGAFLLAKMRSGAPFDYPAWQKKIVGDISFSDTKNLKTLLQLSQNKYRNALREVTASAPKSAEAPSTSHTFPSERAPATAGALSDSGGPARPETVSDSGAGGDFPPSFGGTTPTPDPGVPRSRLERLQQELGANMDTLRQDIHAKLERDRRRIADNDPRGAQHFEDLTDYGALKIAERNGNIRFNDWHREIAPEVGSEVNMRLKRIWDEAQQKYRSAEGGRLHLLEPSEIHEAEMNARRIQNDSETAEARRTFEAEGVPQFPRVYSTWFEAPLAEIHFGRSRKVHFHRMNQALHNALLADSEFAARMERVSPGITERVSSRGRRMDPEGFTWEHVSSTAADGRLGVMRLVPTVQHTSGTRFWRRFHRDPGAVGGYNEWAIPFGAPLN